MNIAKRVRKRLGKRMREAFSFLVAWAELFHDAFNIITGDNSSIVMRMIHAIGFTVIAVFVTVMFENDGEHED